VSPQSPSEQPDGTHSLWEFFSRGVLNSALGEVSVQVTRVAGIVFLARQLEPSDFGLYRIVLIICAFAILINEAGMSEALIQRKMLHASHEATAWWISLLMGLVTAAVLYFGAPLVARLLIMPRLTEQLRLLTLPIILASISSTGGALLKRSFRFGAIALADSIAELSFFAVTIILLLYYKAPRWSLAGGLAAKTCVRAIVILASSRYVPRQLPRLSAAHDLAPFALSVWASGIIISFSSNADYFLVGRILGSSALGFYTIAWDLLRFIPDRLYIVVGRVSLPLFSQLQDNNSDLRRRYCDLVRETSRILLPLMTGLAIAAPQVIVTLYGERWAPAAEPLRVLALGLILVGIAIGTGPVYYAKGRPALDIFLHGARLVLIIAVLAVVAPMGLIAASIGMGMVEGTIAVAGQLMVNSIIELRIARLAEALAPGFRNALLAAASTQAGMLIAFEMGLPHGFLTLLVIGILPAITIGFVEMPRILKVTGFTGKSRANSPLTTLAASERQQS
jgi:O-antigen/teichoic acid export membrane protein